MHSQQTTNRDKEQLTANTQSQPIHNHIQYIVNTQPAHLLGQLNYERLWPLLERLLVPGCLTLILPCLEPAMTALVPLERRL